MTSRPSELLGYLAPKHRPPPPDVIQPKPFDEAYLRTSLLAQAEAEVAAAFPLNRRRGDRRGSKGTCRSQPMKLKSGGIEESGSQEVSRRLRSITDSTDGSDCIMGSVVSLMLSRGCIMASGGCIMTSWNFTTASKPDYS